MSTPDEQQLEKRDDPQHTEVQAGEVKHDDLQPGAGRPLVEGSPMSVSEPVPDEQINRLAFTGAIGLGIGAIVVVLLVLVLLVLLLHH